MATRLSFFSYRSLRANVLLALLLGLEAGTDPLSMRGQDAGAGANPPSMGCLDAGAGVSPLRENILQQDIISLQRGTTL